MNGVEFPCESAGFMPIRSGRTAEVRGSILWFYPVVWRRRWDVARKQEGTDGRFECQLWSIVD
jgi:hypothetical protein